MHPTPARAMAPHCAHPPPPRHPTAEEDYYIREWTAEEVAQGLHTPSMKFALESRRWGPWGVHAPGALPVAGTVCAALSLPR